MLVKSYARNIGLNYVFTSFSTLNFTHGLWMIYLASRGFSLFELGILEGVYHVTSLLMEVPTGVVADIWGRRASRIAGRCTAVLAYAIMFFSQSFPLQAFAFAATALGNNLESGAGDALVYDSLLILNEENRYMHVAGRQELVYQLTSILTFMLGGYFALHSYALVFGLSMGFAALAALVALGFKEPVSSDAPGHTKDFTPMFIQMWRSVVDQVVESIVVLRERKKILFFIVFSELQFCFLTVLFFYLQNHWLSLGLTEFHIGIVFSAHAIVAGVTAWKAHRIEDRIGERGVLTLMPALVVVCLWGMMAGRWSILFHIATGFSAGLLITSVGTYINRLIPSSSRATILSFQSMVFSIFMIMVFPLMGILSDRISISFGFLVMAIMATVVVGVYLMILKPWSIRGR